jgi:hypothetical protein
LANGFCGFTTEVASATTNDPLQINGHGSAIPEMYTHGAYSLGPHGDLEEVQGDDKLYLPLAQLSVPFLENPAKLGEVWTRPLWVVTDLMDREATQVSARHTFDGVTVIDGKQMARICSNYTLDDPITLSPTPTQYAPGARGDRAAFLQKIGQPYSTIQVEQATGVRYAWFDLTAARLARVVDLILYKIPGRGDNAPSYYLVKYEYTLLSEAGKQG